MRRSHFFKTYLVLALFMAVTANRLPKDVIPKEYKLEIITNLGYEDEKFNFKGSVSIQIESITPTDTITMHSQNLNVDTENISLKSLNETDSPLAVKETSLETDDDFLKIKLSETLKSNYHYELVISFEGELQDEQLGYFKNFYLPEGSDKKTWLSITYFKPDNARRAFPCFDEPAFKAKFTISLGRTENYKAISNMPIVNTEKMKDKPGWEWDHFNTTAPMSTYLLAFAITDFEHEDVPQFEELVPIRVWARKETIPKLTDFTLAMGPQLTYFIERYIEIPHPLPKQDVIALPSFAPGDMANFGVIMMDESYIPVDEYHSSTVITSTMARGLVQHWLGGLVTVKWWSDLWLHECLVTYISSLTVKYTFIEWDLTSDMMSVYKFDSLQSSNPVLTLIENPKEIEETLDVYTHNKGYYLVYMIGHFVGEETLRKSVFKYLNTYKFKNAEIDQLLEIITKEAHRTYSLRQDLSVKTVMDKWFSEKSFPLITVTRNYKRGILEVKQETFFRDRDLLGTDSTTKWWIPLTYTTECELDFDKTKPMKWLSPEDDSVTIDIGFSKMRDWIVFNIKASGLYIVNYDEENWNYIIQYLKEPTSKHIPVLNRALLVHHAATLAWVGRLEYKIFFHLISYLQEQELQYYPWHVAIRSIDELDALLKRTPIHDRFRNFVKILVSKINNDLYGPLQDMRVIVILKITSCKYDHTLCVLNAQEQYSMHVSDLIKQEDIADEYLEMVYCTGIRHSSNSTSWIHSLEDYKVTNRTIVKEAIASALGCTRNETLLRQLLDWSLDEANVRKEDVPGVIVGVIQNDNGVKIIKEFFDKNFKALYERITPMMTELSSIITTLARHIVYEDEVTWFESFINTNKEYFSDIKRSIDISLENVKLNLQWLRSNYDSVEDYLKNPIFGVYKKRSYIKLT